MDLGFFNKYPYTDFHELNLDWIIAALKAYAKELNDFVQINAIKYADPLQWDITRQYEKNTVVIDPLTGTAYISVQPVPAGISLARPEYWTVVFDLSVFITAANNNFTVRVETTTTTTATFDTAAGEWLIWDQKLYKANVNITAGDAYIEGSNITRWTVEEGLQALASDLTALTAAVGDLNDLTTLDKTSIVNAINDVVSALTTVVNNVGDLASLNTLDKSSIVAAINEIVSDVSTLSGTVSVLAGNVGTLADLTTTDKTSIVNAINELVNDLGTLDGSITALDSKIGDLADLTTTDKTSIVNAINELVTTCGAIDGEIGDLADLNTVDKSSVVNAINEVLSSGSTMYVTPEQYGALGDSIHDDTQAFRDAIATGLPVKLRLTYPTAYLITDTIDLNNEPLIIFGIDRSQTHVKYEGAGYLFDNVGNTSRISEIAFTGISTNNFLRGTVYNYLLDNTTIHYFDRAIYCNRDDWTGYNRFSRVHIDHCNDVYNLVTRSRTQNLFTFDNCDFLDISRLFNVGQVEAWSFNGCTFERVDDVFNVAAITELWSVEFNGGYFEASHVIRDNGYPVKGSVNFNGGWIWHGTATAFYILQITRATDDYRLVINLDNMAIHSDAVLFDLTDKVRGTFEGYTYNSSGTGVQPSSLYTNTGAQVIKTYDDKRFKYSLPVEAYVKFATGLATSHQATGMVSLDTSGNNLLFNIGQGNSLPMGRLVPTIVSSNSLTDIQASAMAAGSRYCFGIVVNTGKLYVLIDSTWYEVTKTAI